MRRRLMVLATALVVVGASPLLMESRASADPVQTQASVYRCHATVTVSRGFIVGTEGARIATGSGVCLRDGDTQQLDRIELSGTWSRDGGNGVPQTGCPPFRYSFDHVRLWSSYFVNRTQEWREVRSDNAGVSSPADSSSPRAFGVYESANSSVPESFGIAQTDQDTCAAWLDISAPDFTTTADWTFPTGYPFSGPPPSGLLGLCVTEYRLVPIPQTCIEI
jgi:hypothetical protein